MELNILQDFTTSLFHTNAIDEVEPLVARYLEAAKAKSENQGCLCFFELCSLYTSARLHEVLCTCTTRVGSPSHCSALAFRQASVTGITSPAQRHMHSLNLTRSPGTREASRGREGGARCARPHARERGSSARPVHSMHSVAAQLQRAPQDPRPGAWGGGAHRVGGGRAGQAATASA